MPDENYTRRLSAILSADVVGYSRLMGEDEFATVSTLRSHRNLITEKIGSFNGRVVDSPGDNMLAEFNSIVDAVSCAVEIQDALEEKNKELSEDRKMRFRIGVNLGDVVQDGHRIHGDGVNIAARIEGLADPGGVSISGTAFDSVRNKLPYGYQFSGEQKVKNIVNPIRVYKVLTTPEHEGKVIGETHFIGRISRKVAITAMALLAIVTVGLVVYNIHLHQSGRIEPASTDKMAFPLPDRPSIAVLPFDNMSNDPEQEYFTDGLTDDIITALSKTRDVFVIARHSAFTYKGKSAHAKQVAEEMGVRYVLQGSIRKAEDRVRVTAQLVDALNGDLLWAERYDRALEDVFSLQDEITMNILTALQVKLTEGEKFRVLSRGTTNFSAYQKWQKGRAHMVRFNISDNMIGRELLEKAISLDPEFVSPHVDLAWTHLMEIHLGASDSPKESFKKASQLAQKAVSLDESSPFAQTLLGVILTVKRQHEDAIAQGKKAVDLSPSYSLAQAQLGRTLMYSGRFEEALSWLEKAIRLDPIPMNWFITCVGLCYLHTGRVEKAAEEFKKVLHRNPKDLTALVRLVVAYSLLDQQQEARSSAAELLRLNPKFTIASVKKAWPYKNKEDLDLNMNALRKAGLPETRQQ